jgi:hypothetical protein
VGLRCSSSCLQGNLKKKITPDRRQGDLGKLSVFCSSENASRAQRRLTWAIGVLVSSSERGGRIIQGGARRRRSLVLVVSFRYLSRGQGGVVPSLATVEDTAKSPLALIDTDFTSTSSVSSPGQSHYFPHYSPGRTKAQFPSTEINRTLTAHTTFSLRQVIVSSCIRQPRSPALSHVSPAPPHNSEEIRPVDPEVRLTAILCSVRLCRDHSRRFARL